MLKGKRIILIGGAGFIGVNLAAHFVEKNKVTIFDLDYNLLKNTNLLKNKKISFVKGSVLNKKKLDNAIKGRNIVIHLASVAHVENIYKDPYMNMKICLDGTKNVLDSCVKNKVSKMIYFSTSEVYGPHAFGVSERVITKQGTNEDLRWTYSVGKVSAEHLTNYYFKEKGLNTTIVRPFNIYGNGQNSGAIFQMIKSAYLERKLYVNGEGSQVRAYCHVEDLNRAIEKIITNKKSLGKTYNIGNPWSATTMIALADRIKYLLGLNTYLEIKLVKNEKEDVETRVPCINKIKKDLRWEPRISLHGGLVAYIRWFRSMAKQAKAQQRKVKKNQIN